MSPVPPPLQFANNEVAANQHSAAKSVSSNTKFSASSQFKSIQKTNIGAVKVLPTPNKPVQLQEPFSSKDHVDSINSNEADVFIEQLLKEAETDPKLRELTYGKKPNENYPKQVTRPYRTAQDLVIKDQDDSRSPSAASRQACRSVLLELAPLGLFLSDFPPPLISRN